MVSVSPQPQKKSTKKLRNMAVILFAGFSLTVVAPLFAESLSTRRRTRQRGAAPKQPTDDGPAVAGAEPTRPEPARPARLPTGETRIGPGLGTSPPPRNGNGNGNGSPKALPGDNGSPKALPGEAGLPPYARIPEHSGDGDDPEPSP